ncbi:hypothetical protein [Lewinella sp. 4G2]|uniref:hypothetical protein n=1 Tax=Lewinella sp. 4G2 TaxID=1803372 RepID=UPI0007B4A207|nr:hypothetical protein [Lewinella sp. 4G2]OAV44102.1 hypothetical protein A3850_006130 [Lewinella sp. 4G2]
MEFLDRILLIVHVVAGFSSLALFFVPAFARKGGRVHNQFGRFYVYGMWVVVTTAFLLSIINYLQGRTMQALFLGFLAFLTARPLYYGIAVLRHKRGSTPKMRRIDFAFRLVLGTAGPYLIGAGLGWWGDLSSSLLVVFGVLGTLSSWPTFLREIRGVQPQGYNWMEEHIRHIVITAIAGFTAFFAFGGHRIFGDLFSGHLQTAGWIAPTVIGLIFTQWYKRRLRAGKVKFGNGKRAKA